jgi:hypothetical protein
MVFSHQTFPLVTVKTTILKERVWFLSRMGTQIQSIERSDPGAEWEKSRVGRSLGEGSVGRWIAALVGSAVVDDWSQTGE